MSQLTTQTSLVLFNTYLKLWKQWIPLNEKYCMTKDSQFLVCLIVNIFDRIMYYV